MRQDRLGKDKEDHMGEHTVVDVDIAKSVFEVAVSKQAGRVSDRRRLSRGAFLVFLAQVPQGTVVMEACGSAHYWGRKIQELGHQVRPYVTRNKTDRTDAKGILEAYRNADIHPVPVKSVAQQVLVSLHRFRSGWISCVACSANWASLSPRGSRRCCPR